MKRPIIFIDGLNFYHSVVDASYDLGLKGKGTKWLNIASLYKSYFPLISKDAIIGKNNKNIQIIVAFS